MARRVIEAGFPLTIWARRPESVAPYAGTGVVVARRPKDVGAASDLVGVCVVADADVEEVVLGDSGVVAGMAPGGIVVIHATVHPDTCRTVQRKIREAGVRVVDAPVSGGGMAAAARQLLVMAGGDEEDVATCRPVFDTFADPVLHLGPLGSGQVAKLLNNLVFTAQITVARETFSFADGLGVDPAALAQVLAHASGGSRAAAILAATGFNLAGLRQAAGLLEKDLGIVLDVAASRSAGAPEGLVALARRTLATLAESPAGP
jgi:3-hydroxyisobutyrate dehydrogenase-like beta-hydroxyacid dehydrogenase